jgi:hypothetical protein
MTFDDIPEDSSLKTAGHQAEVDFKCFVMHSFQKSTTKVNKKLKV